MTEKWDRRFLQLAAHVSKWSKDPSTQVGAVLVDKDYTVRGIGFNGFARGVTDSAMRLADRSVKYELIVHAEVNAILAAGHHAQNSILYVWPTIMYPPCCPRCASVIVQAGVLAVICEELVDPNPRWHEVSDLSRQIFTEGKVQVESLPLQVHP